MKVFIVSVLFFLISIETRADMPNAFHKEQLASGAIATFMDSCQESFRKNRPDLTTYVSLYVCSCMGDWLRDHPNSATSFEGFDMKAMKYCSDWGIKEVQKSGRHVYQSKSH